MSGVRNENAFVYMQYSAGDMPLQFVIKLVMMFLIHWGYSLLCIGLCVGIW